MADAVVVIAGGGVGAVEVGARALRSVLWLLLVLPANDPSWTEKSSPVTPER